MSIVFLKDSQGEVDLVLVCSAGCCRARTWEMDTEAQGLGRVALEDLTSARQLANAQGIREVTTKEAPKLVQA